MNWIDYSIIGFYFLFFLFIGYFFKDNKDSKDYFLGGRKMGWFPLSLSTMATQLSAISFVSAPAFVGLKAGGGMKWLTFEFGVPLAMVFIMLVIIPPLYKSGVVSVYEYLERRYSASTRLIISTVFLITRSFGTGVMVYTVAMILQSVMDISFVYTILLIGVITLIYSFQGGMKAVIWGDVIQMIILFGGILICLGFGFYKIGGWGEFVQHIDSQRLLAVDFSSFGFNGDEFGFWPMLIGGFFLYVSYYGTDQTQSQRMLSAKDLGTVRKLLLVNGLFRFPVTFIYCTMGLVLGTLIITDPSFSEAIATVFASHSDSIKSSTDLMVPVFITKYLPNGVIGILLVAIVSAAMSSLSSTINSLSAVSVEDFGVRFNWVSGKGTSYVRFSRFASLFWGLVCILFAFVVGDISDTVIEAINKIGSVSYGPILAAFVMAILLKKTNATGTNVGIITGVVFNIYLWKFAPEVFWFWWNAIGFFLTVVVAYATSLIFKTKKIPSKAALATNPLVFSKEVLYLAGYTLFMILLAMSVPKIFS